MKPENLQNISTLKKVVPLLKTCHQQMRLYHTGSTLIFWVFQVIRGYVNSQKESKGRMIKKLSRFLEINHEMVSEIYSILDFDYVQYTANYLERFKNTFAEFRKI